MKTVSWLAAGVLGVAALVTACNGLVAGDDVDTKPTDPNLETLAKRTAPQLNLSHIACADDGTVTAHFVLLFWGSSTPPDLTGTSNQGPFTASASKNSGNVWHYNVTLSAGEIEILSASVGGVTLHNPGEYSGNYACGPTNPECPVQVTAGQFCADPSTLGNPGNECAYLGLAWTEGKDDNLTGPSFTVTESAYVAIVKGGNGGTCPIGQASYNVYTNVTAWQTSVNTGNGTDVSHVTYCACPAQ
jgi:hypothetical protein